MSVRIENMGPRKIGEYARLFAAVFSAEPWKEPWTEETAARRIHAMMGTGTFAGKALYDGDDLKGVIWGQMEPYYNGVHFQIQELCVATGAQHSGYGSALVQALKDELGQAGVVQIYLITAKGPRTEGFYRKHGFAASDHMILMNDAASRNREHNATDTSIKG